MNPVLLINPNTSAASTRMMAAIASRHLGGQTPVHALTATRGASLIADAATLTTSATEVQRLWRQAQAERPDWTGVLVACFGDPGVAWLRTQTALPVIGIGEAAIRDAGRHGRRFSIVTTTPDLALPLAGLVAALGLSAQYLGLRAPPSAPARLMANDDRLRTELQQAVNTSIAHDGAEAVVIGGGPLGEVADRLTTPAGVQLIAPLASAACWLRQQGLATICPAADTGSTSSPSTLAPAR